MVEGLKWRQGVALKLRHFVAVLHGVQHGEGITGTKVSAQSHANAMLFCGLELKQATAQKKVGGWVWTQH